MKIEPILFKILLGVVIVTIAIFLLSPQIHMLLYGPTPTIAPTRDLPLMILSVTGEVEYLPPGEVKWIKLRPGEILYEGVKIRTKEEASVVLYSGKEIMVSILEKTELKISRAKIREGKFDVELELKEGETITTVRKLPPGSEFAIKTPFATFRAIDATWYLQVTEDEYRIVVMRGEVVAEDLMGRKIVYKPERKVKVVRRMVPEKVEVEVETLPAEAVEELSAHAKKAMEKLEIEIKPLKPEEIDVEEEIKIIKKIIRYCVEKIEEREVRDIIPFMYDPFIFNEQKFKLKVLIDMLVAFVEKHTKIKIIYDEDKITIKFTKDVSKCIAIADFKFRAMEIRIIHTPEGPVEEELCRIEWDLSATLVFWNIQGAWICARTNIEKIETK
jgi:hypothetical protein